MSRPDLIYGRIGRPTCAMSGITAARLQMKPMEPILEVPLCDAGAMHLLHVLLCSSYRLKIKCP